MNKKCFLIEFTYRVPADQLGDIVEEHRAFLRSGYEQGILLLSGPQQPRIGGIAIGHADSFDAIQAFFFNDPYNKNGMASYRFVEFNPILHQPFLSSWLEN